ncbi:hypothetical protein [Azorhizobium sp. AG788]|uniref:hypothetical protein n=1 Tax=Azorhizobium sp. AG788 TaxID=2183897 RepID=UPI0031389097
MSDSDAGNASTLAKLLRTFFKWFIGGVSGIAATIITAHLTGLIDKFELNPDDSFCTFIQSRFLEKSYDGELPSIFVAAFSGKGGREAAQELADQIKFRTGLPTLTSCKTVPLSDGPDATRESVSKALDRGRSLASDRHAQIVIIGAMRGNDAADIVITDTLAEPGEVEAIRTHLSLKETKNRSFPDVNSISDTHILPALGWWAFNLENATNRTLPPELSSKMRMAAIALSKLADHRPPLKWPPLNESREKVTEYAWMTNSTLAKKYENCDIILNAYKNGTTILEGQISREKLSNSKFENKELFIISANYYLRCLDDGMKNKFIQYIIFEKAKNFIDEISNTKLDANFFKILSTIDPWPGFINRDAIELLAMLTRSQSDLVENFEKKEIYKNFSTKIFSAFLLIDRAKGMLTSAEIADIKKCMNYDYSPIDSTKNWERLISMNEDPTKILKLSTFINKYECNSK